MITAPGDANLSDATESVSELPAHSVMCFINHLIITQKILMLPIFNALDVNSQKTANKFKR